MNKNNLLAGLGGALVLTLLNESLKHVNGEMPRIDLVGEEALEKTIAYFGLDLGDKTNLYEASLVGDLITNTAYFSLIDGEGSELWKKAASAGVMAGFGAVNLPSAIGLDDAPVAKSTATKAWTIGYYVLGALTTAILHRVLDRFETK